MASMKEITCVCGCNRTKMVRAADIKRGWGRYYSKSCKAKQQAKSSGGRKYKFSTLINAYKEGRVSSEYAVYITMNEYPQCVERLERETGIDVNNYFMDHPFSSESLGQW